jgi:hypothetical protein
MMEAARTSETSIDNYFTRQIIPEDNSELHSRRRENLKSHKYSSFLPTVDLYVRWLQAYHANCSEHIWHENLEKVDKLK